MDLSYVYICFKTTYLTYEKKNYNTLSPKTLRLDLPLFFSAFYPDSKKSGLSVLFVNPTDKGKLLFTRPLSDPHTATT